MEPLSRYSYILKTACARTIYSRCIVCSRRTESPASASIRLSRNLGQPRQPHQGKYSTDGEHKTGHGEHVASLSSQPCDERLPADNGRCGGRQSGLHTALLWHSVVTWSCWLLSRVCSWDICRRLIAVGSYVRTPIAGKEKGPAPCVCECECSLVLVA